MNALLTCLLALTVHLGSSASSQIVSSSDKKVESHHSLRPPLDSSQVYWNFGGSTVLTKNFIRLTPSTQDRRGWLWNEYPLEADSWEVEFKFEVFSKPHYGGDGFGFWVMAGDQDPTFSRDVEAMNGPVFGMKGNFVGFGVVFDTYDNDNRRNNPSVFVLRNDMDQPFKYNHDNDFEDDAYRVPPDNKTDPKRPYLNYKCVADVRNTGKVSSALVRLLHQNLHVYIDTKDGQGYRFCLAVGMGRSYRDYHIAFSAATGQVADNMDVSEVTTRYLEESMAEFDDSTLPSYGSSAHHSWGTLARLVLLAIGGGAFAITAYQTQQFRSLTSLHIDDVPITRALNPWVKPHLYLSFALSGALLLCGHWFVLLLSLPLLGSQLYLLAVKKLEFSALSISKRVFKLGAGLADSAKWRLQLRLAYEALLAAILLFNFFFH